MPPLKPATITDVTYLNDATAFDTRPEPSGQSLNTFTVASTVYQAFGATASNIVGGGTNAVATDDTPGTTIATLSGLSVTSVLTNVGSVDFGFGITITDDTIPMFFGEVGVETQYGAGDAATLHPIVNGTVDTTWSIDITSASYSFNNVDSSPDEWSTDEINREIHTELTAFVLSDFTGGTGTLTDVTGFQMLDDDGTVNADPVLGGYGTAVPEPSSALLGSLALLGLLRRRRT